MLSLRPQQKFVNVNMSTPTPAEKDNCKVELLESAKQGGSGWLLRDPRGLPLRRFYNTKFVKAGDNTHIDVWSYYQDGVEVYREWARQERPGADHFR